MQFNSAFAAAVLAYCAIQVSAAPLPQLAGEGAACNSILSSTDNGVGYGVENAEDGIAKNLKRFFGYRRQLAGEGSACDSVLSSTDNGVGYGIENAEVGVAKLLGGSGTTTTGGSSSGSGGAPPPPPPPPPKGPKHRRQLDKIAEGAQTLAEAAKIGSETDSTTSELVNLDGQLTSGAANLGAQAGNSETSMLEGLGASIPKRQLDKIAKGAQSVAEAAKIGSETEATTSELVTLDGQLTSGAANLGAEIGHTETSTLEGIGASVP